MVTVGIAYGSDVEQATALLMKVANDSPLVMKDPAPSAIFRRFGDSALEFDLRVFIENRDDWAEFVHEVHRDIYNAFARAGIEIAFPQRDIHIRTIQGLPPGAFQDPATTAGRRD